MATKEKLGNWCLNKGYPRYTSGQYRGQYVHRVKMQLKLGRELRRDEDVHHRDLDKLNFQTRNLQVLDHAIHGYVSSKQRWYMNNRDKREKKEWDEYFTAEALKELKAGG